MTFDPNLRMSLWDDPEEAKTQMLWGLRQADIVKISDEEVRFLWGCSAREGAQRLLDEYGVKLAMVTMGANGALLVNRRASVTSECPPVHPVDTTGAGDIFGGSAVSRIIKLGKKPEDLDEEELNGIAAFATIAASLSTQKPGGIPSVPDEDDVFRMITEVPR